MAEKVEYELSLRDLLSAKIDAANASVNRLEKSLGSVKNSATNLGSALGVTFGIAGVVAFTKSVITAGTTVENALTGLTTLLKDSKEAQEVIDNTMKDAQTTPFDFEVLLSANKALISADVAAKDARADVLNLANAIAATGGGNDELQRMVVNLQQIKNTGKASALDIKQFAYAGVNLYKVLEAAGQKIVKNGKEQEITYKQIAESLKKAHEAGGIYYNGLENMAGNTSVKISNLGDAFFQLSAKIFKDLKPAIEKVISAMFKFVDWLKKAWEWCVKI
jgi:tape measure domain